MRYTRPMAETKTRLAVTVDRVDRELFSVLDKKNGDLMITVKSAEEFELGHSNTFVGVKQHRFSVHTSPQSPGNTLTCTTEDVDGIVVKTSAFALPSRQGLCWPLFALLCPSLRADRYLVKPRAGDRMRVIDRYNPDRGTLVYFVIITSKQLVTLRPDKRCFSTHVIQCTNFCVHVWHTFLTAPSINQGGYALFVTSPPQIDGVAIDAPFIPNAPSFTAPALRDEMARALQLLGSDHHRRTVRHVTADGLRVPMGADRLFGQCTRRPLGMR